MHMKVICIGLKSGDKVKYSLQSLPGKNFEGKVIHIDPFIDPTTRVAKVRTEQHNPGLSLKPEMFVNGFIESKYCWQQPMKS